MLDFQALGRDRGIPIIEGGHHHTSTGWVQTHCPFCSPGSGFHLGFSLQRGCFHCWRCGKHRTWDVVVRLLGSTSAAKEAIGRYQTGARSVLRQPTARRRTAWSPPGISPLSPAHRKYLRRRGFNVDKLVEIWGLAGTRHLSGAGWNWRVVFPIRNRGGTPVAYGGRSIIKGTKPKYRLTKGEQMSEDPHSMLYGIDKIPGNSVVIVEGPADVWRLGPGAVALLGVNWKTEQANLLREFPHRFILLDPDTPGQRRASRLADYLGVYSGETEIITGMDSDPGDLDQEEADSMMREFGFSR